MSKKIITLLLLGAFVLAACGGSNQNNSGRPAADITVNFAYDSAVQYWIEPMIDAFNNTATKTADGKVIAVTGKPMVAEDMVEAMLGATPPYSLIIVSDPVWGNILADRRKQHGDAALTLGACTPLAKSPLVMTTWQSMADVLGWPERDFTWHDISDLALSPSAWQGYDHPEWGTLTFGHAHPILSDGGLEATLGEAYAAGPLTASDVQSDVTKSYVRVVERAITRYGSDTTSLIKTMADKGQHYLHVAVGYESDVIANHRGADPLVAIYPTETFEATFSGCVVNNDPGATQFIQYLTSKTVQQAALSSGYRPVDGSIALGNPIDTSHGADPNAKYKVIPMPSADVITTVQDIWNQLKRPLNVTLVIDVSGSMRDGGKIEGVRAAAAAFVNRLGDTDQITVYTFSTDYKVLISPEQVGRNRDIVTRAVSNLNADGGTALYDTVQAARQAIKPDSNYINAVVVLTDGQDTESTTTIQALLTSLKSAKGNVFIYTIGYGSDANGDVLGQIADAGNGTYYASDPNTIGQVYLEIASQFGGSRGLGR